MGLVLSAPSGGGKSTLSRLLLERDTLLTMSVSLTTRPKRHGEEEGQDYYFVSQGEFIRQRDTGDLLEWAEVYGHHYGTPRRLVEALLAQGKDVLFDVDGQGMRQLRVSLQDNMVSIFMMPSTLRELKRRLEGRGVEKTTEMERRISAFSSQLATAEHYDYVVLNDDVETCYKQLHEILNAERKKRIRYHNLKEFIASM